MSDFDWDSYKPGTVCQKCQKERTPEGHDPCLGTLPGVDFACCGHGEDEGYIAFSNGMCVRMYVTRVEDRAWKRTDTPPAETAQEGEA